MPENWRSASSPTICGVNADMSLKTTPGRTLGQKKRRRLPISPLASMAKLVAALVCLRAFLGPQGPSIPEGP
jgi:hypothetical protein